MFIGTPARSTMQHRPPHSSPTSSHCVLMQANGIPMNTASRTAATCCSCTHCCVPPTLVTYITAPAEYVFTRCYDGDKRRATYCHCHRPGQQQQRHHCDLPTACILLIMRTHVAMSARATLEKATCPQEHTAALGTVCPPPPSPRSGCFAIWSNACVYSPMTYTLTRFPCACATVEYGSNAPVHPVVQPLPAK